MREIVLDTETTGLDPALGHRVVEIGCVELMNYIPTGAIFHVLINPERDMPPEAEAIHGHSTAFLADKPKFIEIADSFLEFVADSKIIIHNAGFDFGFLNHELERCTRELLQRERIIDTLALARRRHPGGPNRLDDLCARYGIDNSRRTKHGALLDAELLAEVYAELIGGRQARLGLDQRKSGGASAKTTAARTRPAPLAPRVSEAEQIAHRALLEALGEKAIWNLYGGKKAGA
jgi:DNA polymerase-3 subunit epsilon